MKQNSPSPFSPTLQYLMQTAAASTDSDLFAMIPLIAAVCELAGSTAKSRIMLGGSSNLFGYKDYASDAIELLDFLSRTEPVAEMISSVKDPLNVKIGRENLYRQLENSSVIVAKYSVGGSDSGTIGIIGPTRMDYENIIPSVKYLTSLVGSLITQALEE